MKAKEVYKLWHHTRIFYKKVWKFYPEHTHIGWSGVEHTYPAYWAKMNDYSQPLPPKNYWTYYNRWHNCRHVRTLQEVRYNSGLGYDHDEAKEYGKDFIDRGNRVKLPSLWDDIRVGEPKRSWKRTHKVRKQWMKNL